MVIRKQVFAARKAHTDQQIDDWSRKIAETVTALSEYSNSRRILAYADYNHEVMTKYIIEAAWKDGKEVAVPKVVGQDMVFYKLTDFAQLEKGYFGIPEPARGEIVQWEEALMIMPGVAFDRQNHRVGYGGGFYDKYLEKHPEQYRRIARLRRRVSDNYIVSQFCSAFCFCPSCRLHLVIEALTSPRYWRIAAARIWKRLWR